MKDQLRRTGRALRRTAKRSPAAREIYAGLVGGRQKLYLGLSGFRSRFAKDDVRGVNPANMVWIFGSGRSGSTWLRSIMGELTGHRIWEEPMVGQLFGEFYARTPAANRRMADFIMGDPIRKGWKRSVRNFVLDGADYSQPGLGSEDYLIVKEPNGSVGAPIIMEAIPEARMILLIRDPRDVIASVLDAARGGGWLQDWRGKSKSRRGSAADRNPDRFVRRRAKTYRQGVKNALRAYKKHKGPKVLVRYEDLLANTAETMKRIYATLNIPVDDKELARAVAKHSWESIPEEEKGSGKFYRKGTPGGWREDLTPEQAALVERITAPLMEDLYPSS